MPDIEETELPGVGVLHEFVAQSGQRLGVVTRRSGRREFVIYDHADPDAVAASVPLTVEDSAALAELLGGSRVAQRVADVQQHIEGLAIDWLVLGPTSTAIGSTIAQIRVRTETGTSIVAVLREGTAVPAPGPDFELLESDTVVVVGTPEGIEAAAKLLGSG
ncbi:MAG: cation:proton antiporter regulatory subunit [Acidimicrobiales bacterium]